MNIPDLAYEEDYNARTRKRLFSAYEPLYHMEGWNYTTSHDTLARHLLRDIYGRLTTDHRDLFSYPDDNGNYYPRPYEKSPKRKGKKIPVTYEESEYTAEFQTLDLFKGGVPPVTGVLRWT